MAQRPATRLRLVETPPDLRLVPEPERVCSNCVNAALGPYGVHCIVFGEDILRETVAAECGMWES